MQVNSCSPEFLESQEMERFASFTDVFPTTCHLTKVSFEFSTKQVRWISQVPVSDSQV